VQRFGEVVGRGYMWCQSTERVMLLLLFLLLSFCILDVLRIIVTIIIIIIIIITASWSNSLPEIRRKHQNSVAGLS
jgi:hypothetical protein